MPPVIDVLYHTEGSPQVDGPSSAGAALNRRGAISNGPSRYGFVSCIDNKLPFRKLNSSVSKARSYFAAPVFAMTGVYVLLKLFRELVTV